MSNQDINFAQEVVLQVQRKLKKKFWLDAAFIFLLFFGGSFLLYLGMTAPVNLAEKMPEVVNYHIETKPTNNDKY